MPIETRTITVYNPDACAAPVMGCMSSDAINYNAAATVDDGSCEWGNDPASAVYYKNDCPVGQTGSNYTLNVAANEYISDVSKAQANLDRDADMPIRGQSLANSTGYCILPEPEETGVVELSRVEYQKAKDIGGFTRPSMIKVKLIRSSLNGSSGVTGNIELREGSVAGPLVEVLPGFTFAPGSNCTTVQTTIGLNEFGSYYVLLTAVDQENYDIVLPGSIAVFVVEDYSSDINCI